MDGPDWTLVKDEVSPEQPTHRLTTVTCKTALSVIAGVNATCTLRVSHSPSAALPMPRVAARPIPVRRVSCLLIRYRLQHSIDSRPPDSIPRALCLMRSVTANRRPLARPTTVRERRQDDRGAKHESALHAIL
jgi:hypothetical protein